MSLSVHLFIKHDTLFIRLRGELDHHTSIELRERVNILMSEYEIKNIVFNIITDLAGFVINYNNLLN